MKRHTFLLSFAFLLLLHAGCRPIEPEVAAQPNILWITSEDMNAFLGAYGDLVAKTPNLDKIVHLLGVGGGWEEEWRKRLIRQVSHGDLYLSREKRKLSEHSNWTKYEKISINTPNLITISGRNGPKRPRLLHGSG